MRLCAASCYRFSSLSVVLIAVTVGIAGCGSGNTDDGKVRTDVAISITYGSEPVTEAQVDLHNPQSGDAAGGQLDDSGVATIDGVAHGSYVVTVVPPTPLPKPPEPGEPPLTIPEYPNIPQKYRSTASSPLKAEINDETGELKFDLKDAE